jgi:hypothetical protein
MSRRAGLAVCVTCVLAVAAEGLAQTPAEQKVKEFVENLRGRVSEATFDNGRYRHAGIELEVPPEWQYGGTLPDENPADDTAHWNDPQTGVSLYVWLSRRKAAPEDLDALFASALSDKAVQRERQGFRRWQIRPESVEHVSIGGRQAVVAVADFESRSGAARVERLTWIYTRESRVLFFATMSPGQVDAFTPAFDRVARSANLP